jgi:hypothetical protein
MAEGIAEHRLPGTVGHVGWRREKLSSVGNGPGGGAVRVGHVDVQSDGRADCTGRHEGLIGVTEHEGSPFDADFGVQDPPVITLEPEVL